MLKLKSIHLWISLKVFWLHDVFVTGDDSRFALTLLLAVLEVGF